MRNIFFKISVLILTCSLFSFVSCGNNDDDSAKNLLILSGLNSNASNMNAEFYFEVNEEYLDYADVRITYTIPASEGEKTVVNTVDMTSKKWTYSYTGKIDEAVGFIVSSKIKDTCPDLDEYVLNTKFQIKLMGHDSRKDENPVTIEGKENLISYFNEFGNVFRYFKKNDKGLFEYSTEELPVPVYSTENYQKSIEVFCKEKSFQKKTLVLGGDYPAKSFGAVFTNHIETPVTEYSNDVEAVVINGSFFDGKEYDDISTEMNNTFLVGFQGNPVILLMPSATQYKKFISNLEDAGISYDSEYFDEHGDFPLTGEPSELFWNFLMTLEDHIDEIQDSDEILYKAVEIRNNDIHFVLNIAEGDDECQLVDNFIRWNTELEKEDSENDNKSRAAISRGDSYQDLTNLMNAQKWSTSFWAKTSSEAVVKDREVVNIDFYVWAVCDIDRVTDYYLCKQVITANNNQIDCGPTKSNMYWRIDNKTLGYGDYMRELKATNELLGATDYKVSDISPVTQNGSSTVSEGFSWNFGGNLGMNSTGPTGGISGGISYNSSTSRSIPDISITAVTDTAKLHNPTWTYTGGHVTNYGSGFLCMNRNHTSPSNLQKGMFVANNSWIWKVENASGSYKLKSKVDLDIEEMHSYDDGWGGWSTSSSYVNEITSHINECVLLPPSRYVKNYHFDSVKPEGWDDAKAQRFRQYLTEVSANWTNTWKTSIAIYTLTKDDPEPVKNYFQKLVSTIEKNKNVLKDNGYTGSIDFYVQDPGTGKKLATKTVEID